MISLVDMVLSEELYAFVQGIWPHNCTFRSPAMTNLDSELIQRAVSFESGLGQVQVGKISLNRKFDHRADFTMTEVNLSY